MFLIHPRLPARASCVLYYLCGGFGGLTGVCAHSTLGCYVRDNFLNKTTEDTESVSEGAKEDKG